MRNIDILANFEREIGLLDDVINKPSSDDSLYWLNQGINKFVKLRFNGDLVHRTSYEQNEKRLQDLRQLLVTGSIKPTKVCGDGYTKYHIEYPDNFLYALNEDVVISDTSGNNKLAVPVFECTADSFMYRVNNKLTDFHYHRGYARPLRIHTKNGCDLLTDGKYVISKYTLGYLRKPQELKLEKPFDEYTDFIDNVMYEIIKIAAQMYIENTQSQRYQGLTNEVNTQE